MAALRPSILDDPGTIQDNGQGFDLKTVKKGLGLSTMRERAVLSGGAFELESAIGKGTTVRAYGPFDCGMRIAE
jgi:signal transduction histidine kinase